jgi:release factor glutamine methyltransferase
MTVLELLKKTSEYFQQKGIESPRLNIDLLVAKILGCGRMDLYMQFDRELYEDELDKLRELVRRRVNREPLQHLLGDVEFMGLTFLCDARALVPRPETELLVDTLLRKFSPLKGPRKKPKTKVIPLGETSAPEEEATAAEKVAFAPTRLLDLCTGSGVIALSLAHHWPGAEVTATDLSPEALALAGENAVKLGLKPRLLQGDLYAALPDGDPRYDGIVSNPPYIPSGELPGLQREVQFDPALALDGGGDGLDLIRRIVAEAPQHLVPGGWLALEVHHDQGPAVADLLRGAGFDAVEVVEDYSGIGRFVMGVLR